jgi:predicted RNase H-like HicB family nuclease
MERLVISFTAVYLKGDHGYDGFVEELPEVNSHGRTIEEVREGLRSLTASIFHEKRALFEELLKGRDVVREPFLVGIGATTERLQFKAGRSWPMAVIPISES